MHDSAAENSSQQNAPFPSCKTFAKKLLLPVVLGNWEYQSISEKEKSVFIRLF